MNPTPLTLEKQGLKLHGLSSIKLEGRPYFSTARSG
jgi:hypothetical protein